MWREDQIPLENERNMTAADRDPGQEVDHLTDDLIEDAPGGKDCNPTKA